MRAARGRRAPGGRRDLPPGRPARACPGHRSLDRRGAVDLSGGGRGDVLVLGHRGGRGDGWPVENTVEAFAQALAQGADGVELDVRLTADGEVVCFHDPTLARATGGEDRRALAATPARGLPRLGGGLSIPTLAAALEACRGRVVNVEVKADHVPGRLALARAAARVVLASGRPDDVVFSSFDPRIVLALAAFAPRVARGVLVGARTAPLATVLPLAMRSVVSAAHVEEGRLDPARIRALRSGGLRVAAWTVNEPERARSLSDAGVETLISDEPGRILGALGRLEVSARR